MKNLLKATIILSLFCFAKCSAVQQQTNFTSTNDSAYHYGASSIDGIGKFYYGREIALVMGAAASAWLDRNERQKEENTDLAISRIAIPLNGVIADVGAGTGYYTFRLATRVPEGKVYAVEVQDEMIDYLNKNKKKFNSRNVEVVKATNTSANLPENSIDLAIMVDVYHELEYPHEVLQSIKKSLKSDGKILLIEYRGEDASVPIKPLHKSTVQQLNKEFSANGFKLSYRGDFLPIQHFLLYSKI